ncbi:MAG: aminotransferase class I/II-fold pyridoxal phosphate-dependent enzyme [Actinobacteria bacterium]|nr:aminotransferase class I/II-fold pyridoxal phosphate-dependent enzyme [Actinomycetota bacterium]
MHRIYLSPPDVGALEEEYVLDALRSGWVAPLGPHVEGFEAEMAERVGVEHAVALSSGTAGLHLALMAMGIRPGDEVVVPTMTFGATAFAVNYTGARPVFVDSEPLSWNMDPVQLSDLLASRASVGALPAAVLPVDIYGQTADYASIETVCAEFGVPILEVAAEALGATCGGHQAGTFGRAGVLSFNGNKIMTTSGGGMLVTDDAIIANHVRYLATQSRQPVPWYEHEDIGYNHRLSNVLAAIGRAQLQRLPSMIDRRHAIRDRYASLLADVEGVRILGEAPWGRGNAWLTLAWFDQPDDVERVRLELGRRGIESRHAWKPLHLQPVFAGLTDRPLPVAESLFDHGLCLPSGSVLADDDVEEVAGCIAEVMTDRIPAETGERP